MSRTAGSILKAYWESKIRSGRIPDRADIDPAEIRGVLPDLAMIERAGDGNYRIRLAGTRVSQRCGAEPTGNNFGADHHILGLGELARLLDSTSERKAPLDGWTSNIGTAETFDGVAVTVLPLRRGGETVEMFLVSMEFIVSADQEFGGRQYRNC